MNLAQLGAQREWVDCFDYGVKRVDVDLGACGDGSDQAGRTGRVQGIAVPTFKPDLGEMRRV